MIDNFATVNAYRYLRSLVGVGPTYENLYYCGGSAGSEFLTYNAKKLYLAYSLEVWGFANNTSRPGLTIYNPANAALGQMGNANEAWDVTAAALNFQMNNILTKNIIFSRIALSNCTALCFNGIKVTWP